jgi:general secretion pathway protein M
MTPLALLLNLGQTFARWLEALCDAAAGRSAREQLLLAVFAAFALAAGFWLLVRAPLIDARRAAAAELRHAKALIDWLETGPVLRETPASTASLAERAAASGLQVNRIEPDGTLTRLVFDDADFASIIRWLAALENSGAARITAVTIDRRPEPGRVAADIVLEMAP